MKRLLWVFSFCICSTIFPSALFAETRWTNTSGGTFNWNTSGNWSGTFPPTSADDVRITNDLLSAQTITNAGSAGVVGNTSTINFMAISNGLASTPITVIQNTNVNWVSRFGVQLGKNSTLILTTNAQFGVDNNMTFSIRAGGQPGTLMLSNGANVSAFTLFLVRGAGSTTNPVVNAGTIQFAPGANQQAGINYGQTAAFTNDALGTIVKNGSGTGSFVGTFGVQNRAFINNGTILVNAGTFRMDPRDAFSRGGFQNTATGFVQVNSGAVFELRRTTNAWSNGNAPTNFGTVFLNGGNVVAFDTDTLSTNVSRTIANLGTIAGDGTIFASLNNRTNSFLSPGGLGLGTLDVRGNVTLGSNSTFVVELGLLAGQNDLLTVVSNLVLDANSILDISGGAIGNVYTVATFSAVSGVFGTVTPLYSVTYNPDNIEITLVPEPSSLVLAIIGFAGLVAYYRRKH